MVEVGRNERPETAFYLIAIPPRCVSPPDFSATEATITLYRFALVTREAASR